MWYTLCNHCKGAWHVLGTKCNWWNESNYECLGRNVSVDVLGTIPTTNPQFILNSNQSWLVYLVDLYFTSTFLRPTVASHQRNSSRPAGRNQHFGACKGQSSVHPNFMTELVAPNVCIYIFTVCTYNHIHLYAHTHILHVLHKKQDFKNLSSPPLVSSLIRLLKYVWSSSMEWIHHSLLATRKLILLKVGASRMSTAFSEIPDPLWSGKWRLPSFQVDFPYPASPRPDCSSTSKSLTLKTWKQMNWGGAPRCSSPKIVRCFFEF